MNKKERFILLVQTAAISWGGDTGDEYCQAEEILSDAFKIDDEELPDNQDELLLAAQAFTDWCMFGDIRPPWLKTIPGREFQVEVALREEAADNADMEDEDDDDDDDDYDDDDDED